MSVVLMLMGLCNNCLMIIFQADVGEFCITGSDRLRDNSGTVVVSESPSQIEHTKNQEKIIFFSSLDTLSIFGR